MCSEKKQTPGFFSMFFKTHQAFFHCHFFHQAFFPMSFFCTRLFFYAPQQIYLVNKHVSFKLIRLFRVVNLSEGQYNFDGIRPLKCELVPFIKYFKEIVYDHLLY